ncbi:MAG: hypothetical protein HDT44_02565 [Ruminococcaceae bacterium]|nr:hypothetical protein [Oscillospiraceae bacterium]
MKKTNTVRLLKSPFFILYFVILTAERVISLFSQVPFIFIGNPYYEGFKSGLVIVSIAAGWGYLLIGNSGIFKFSAPKNGNDFLRPSVAAGILLVSGMVHTRGTIAPIQFVSYGFLLAAMGIYTAECVKAKGKGALRCLTFAYITAFSMSIPVIYDTTCSCKLCQAFSVTQIWVSLGLIACFTVMSYRFFKNDSISGFPVYEIALAIIGDSAVLFLRWHSEINFFVLFAVITAAILWTAGKIISRTKYIE